MGQNVPLALFNGGEIGKEALARVDLEVYPSTAEVMENVLPLMGGAMIKAPGSEFICALADNTTAKVRPFVFNIDETRVLQFRDGEMRIIDGDAQVAITGAAATIGTPVNNASTGSASVLASGQDITFTATPSGEARAYWPITSGVNGSPTTFKFRIERRPLKIRIGTTTSAEDILNEITLDPGDHVITFTPTATTYYFRARLDDAGKAILSGLQRMEAGALAIPTPYAADDLQSLRFEQSNDVIWIYHPDYRTRALERRGDTSWSLRLFRPTTGPFEVLNTSTTTLTPSARVGSATLSASSALFSASSVGQIFQLEHQGQTRSLDATAVDQASETVRVIGVASSRIFSLSIAGTFSGSVKLQRSAGNDVDWQDVATYSISGVHQIDDDLDNQVIYYRVLCSAFTSGTIECIIYYAGGTTTGRCEIVAYTSPTSVTIEIFEAFGSASATTLWNEGSWSDALGWPAAGGIDESRHALGFDDRFFSSEVDDYEGYELGANSSDAISRRLGTGDVNAVRWIESGEQLLIGTSGGEVRIASSAYEEAITPLNVKAKAFGDEGSADAQAIKAGTRVVFIDRTRARLVQCYFDNDSAKIDTDDLTRLHKKVAGEIEEDSGDGFVEIAYQRRPEPRIWAVRSDGQLVTMLYGPKEGVYAWSRVTGANGGLFKSVCVRPGTPEDRVHVIVERVIDGVTVTYHERLALQNFYIDIDADEVMTAPKAWRLQCALSSDGVATDTFSGLDHLEGEEVRVWGDGRDAGAYTVVGGSITTSFPIEYAIIGLNYSGRWKSSKLAYGAQYGTALTMHKEVSRLGVVVHETPVGAIKYGRSWAEATDALSEEFEEGMTMDAPVTLWSKEYNQPFSGASEIDSRVYLVMDTPAPAMVLALVPGVDVQEQV